MGKHVNMLLSQKYTQLPEMFRVAAVSSAGLMPTLHRFVRLILSPLPRAEQLGVTQPAVLLCAGTSPPLSGSEQPTRLLPSTPPAFPLGCVPLNSLLFLLGALPSCTLLDSLSPCTASPYLCHPGRLPQHPLHVTNVLGHRPRALARSAQAVWPHSQAALLSFHNFLCFHFLYGWSLSPKLCAVCEFTVCYKHNSESCPHHTEVRNRINPRSSIAPLLPQISLALSPGISSSLCSFPVFPLVLAVPCGQSKPCLQPCCSSPLQIIYCC